MAESQTGANEQQAGPKGAGLNVLGQYIKDLSFEVPNAPAIFSEMQQGPNINIDLDTRVQNLQEGVYEVVVTVRAEAKVQDTSKTAFIAELDYAGVFQLSMPEDMHRYVTLVECPRLLFPFFRQVLADVTRDGGFPPLMLAPIDFHALYQQQTGNTGEGDSGEE